MKKNELEKAIAFLGAKVLTPVEEGTVFGGNADPEEEGHHESHHDPGHHHESHHG